MIFGWIIVFLTGFLGVIVNLIVPFTIVFPSATGASAMMDSIDRVVPLDTLLTATLVVWSMRLWASIVSFALWFYDKVPMKST